jgi:hypothetical protein
LKVESVAIAKLRPDPENVRNHPRENLDAIKQSLAEFGQQYPIVAERSGIVRKGSGTLIAAAELGWEKINVVWSELSGARAQAYAIADNRASDLSGFDPDRLMLAIGGLGTEGIDLEALGLAEIGVPPAAEETEPTKLVKHSTIPPPTMAWVLIGIPTVRFREIKDIVSRVAAVPGVLCETALNDEQQQDENG